MTKLFATAICAATVFLTGCTTVVPTALAPSGKTLQFIHASEVNRSCVALGVPEIKIITPPLHGRVNIIQKKFKPTGFGPRNSRYKCRDKLVDGITATYTPDPGYVGKDYVKFRVIFHFNEPPNEDYKPLITHEEYARSFNVK